MFCGERWSLDHPTVGCASGRLTTDAFQPFFDLEKVVLSDVELRAGRRPPNLRLRELYMMRVDLTGVDVSERFPALTWLSVEDMAFDVHQLPRLRSLQFVFLRDTPAPDLGDLLALPELRRVSMFRLRCGAPDCARTLGQQLVRARPALKVRADGEALSP